MSKLKNGAFCFFRNSNVLPMSPELVKELAKKYQVDEAIVPEYAGDRMAFSRAIQASSMALGKRGVLLRPINKNSSSKAVYGIVLEERNAEAEELKHIFNSSNDKITWLEDQPNDVISNGHNPVAEEVNNQYQRLKSKVTSADWTSAITNYLLYHCAATSYRDDGRVYWIPPQEIEKVSKLRTFLAVIGVSMALCEVEPEVRESVKEAAQESLADKLASLKVEADSFCGVEKPSTYTKRIEEYRALKQRATMYKEALGVGVGTVTEVLNKLEEKVSKLLDVRSSLVIHRDGTTSVR